MGQTTFRIPRAAQVSRRAALERTALWAAALALPGAAAVASGERSGSVVDFGADPLAKADSTKAFTQALSQLDRVHVPPGEYLVGDLELRAGVSIEGDGEASILRQRAGSRRVLHADSGSSDVRSNLTGIRIANLQLRGNCDGAGFSEFIHLVSLNGVTGARLDNVIFRGFQGDGLYLGSSDDAKKERHNRDVQVTHCTFDGVNRENRNGISVIDCDGLLVQGCRFLHVARSNMPGAIDIEPDANPWHIVRGLRILNNDFSDIGGGIGGICMYVATALRTPASDILIEGNTLQDVAQAAFSLMQGGPLQPGMSQHIVVRGNQVRGTFQRPFSLRGVSGVEIANNEFDGATQAALIGFRDANAFVRDVSLHNNTFQNCGRVGGVAVAVFSVSGLQVEQNTFRDCGNGSPASYIFDFNSGASNNVYFRANHFLSPGGRAKFVIQREASHRFTPGTNLFAPDNHVDGGLRNQFEAQGVR